MGIGGDAGSLGGRGVVALAGAYGSLVGIGCLMIEPVDPLDLAGERRGEHRVGAVGIAYGRIGRGGQHVVYENAAVGSGIIGPTLDVVKFRYRNFKEFHHIATQMAGFGLFAEDVAHAGNTVAQRYGLDRESRQVEHRLAPRGVYHVKLQVERPLAAEKIHYLAENLHSVGKGMEGHGAPLVLKGECGKQSREPQAVVAVEMGDEYVVQARELEPLAAHGELSPLAAVDHHQRAAVVNYLAGRQMAQRRRSASAAQYVEFEIAHWSILRPVT